MSKRSRKKTRKERAKIKQQEESELFHFEKYSTKKKVRHHITNRTKGGNRYKENLLVMKEVKEKAWHFLFSNMDLCQVIQFLIRTAQMKHYEKINPAVSKYYKTAPK